MDKNQTTVKPLGQKAYGSIPHLPGSRLGPGDYHIHEGQAIIATKKKRDKHDIIIVQEKLDGSNVAIAKVGGEILALTRAGYLAATSKYQQHIYFDRYVQQNRQRFDFLLREGERICGEWLAMAHGTYYDLTHEPFVPFDIMLGKERFCYEEFERRVKEYDFTVPYLINYGNPMPVEAALEALAGGGGHGAADPVEGAVWRVERNNRVDFLTKYVRHDKEDGKYFPERNDGKETWNCAIAPFNK